MSTRSTSTPRATVAAAEDRVKHYADAHINDVLEETTVLGYPAIVIDEPDVVVAPVEVGVEYLEALRASP